MENYSVLIADDDKIFSELTRYVLEENGFNVLQATSPKSAMSLITIKQVDLVLLDLHFPQYKDGISTLKNILANFPKIPVIMVTSENLNVLNNAIEAIKIGAHDFIEKPILEERLIITLNNTLEISKLRNSKSSFKRNRINFVGDSAIMKSLYKEIEEIASSLTPVLITGEKGVGKKLASKMIHELSLLSKEKRIVVNCSRLTNRTFDSKMFGYKYETDLYSAVDKVGYFELANDSTLFFEEISELSQMNQQKLYEVLMKKRFKRITSDENVYTRFRFIASSSVDLETQSKNGVFNKNLYKLINKKILHVPALREHKSDIKQLIQHYLKIFNAVYDSDRFISEDAINRVMDYNWPGNITELLLVLFKSLLEMSDEIIHADDLQLDEEYENNILQSSFREGMLSLEKRFLTDVLNMHDWSVADTAKHLGIDRTNLFKKMKRLNLETRQRIRSNNNQLLET